MNQVVAYQGFKSKMKTYTKKVLHGTVLGPILLNVFVNSLPAAIKTSYGIKYIGDTIITALVTRRNTETSTQIEADSANRCSKINGMKTVSRSGSMVPRLVSIDGILVEIGEDVRLLGIRIDCRLSAC